MYRRAFVKAIAGASAAAAWAQEAADFTLRIGPAEVEIARRKIKTTGYNGVVPGPVLRMREGQAVTIDVYNDTRIPELAHWHGLWIPPEVDGSAEEGTPMVPPRGHQRYRFVPRPAGTRWYHSHIYAGRDLHRGTYTGQFGFLIVEGREDPGKYDQEVLLALHGWEPFLGSMNGGTEGDESSLEVGYSGFTVNSHPLGAGEPVRVKEGQRVLFRILNASASTFHRVALPGHRFMVTALDGNPVPVPRAVSVLETGPGERVDAVVEMDHPGVWVLGDADDRMRKAGLGIVVEYAGRSGEPKWEAAPAGGWDYTAFGRDGDSEARAEPDGRVPLVFRAKWAGNRWVDHWTINGKEFPKTDPIRVKKDQRRQASRSPAPAFFRTGESGGQADGRGDEGRSGRGAAKAGGGGPGGRQSRAEPVPLPHATAHGFRIHGDGGIRGRVVKAGRFGYSAGSGRVVNPVKLHDHCAHLCLLRAAFFEARVSAGPARGRSGATGA
jgi:FtsP/CotA-like multicopper oxidase with cupredoxin domain